MEENVALDSSKQKKFIKSIKGIKKLIKKKDAEPKPFVEGNKGNKVKEGKVTKKTRKAKGLVYLSHIPHGFYEHEMTQYFKQFGVVTNARVIKSKRTGRSKGYAFVEFKDPAVAEIVADTMNNYLMGKRLIKAAVIPPEKQRRAFRKHWSAVHNPGNSLRIKMKKAHNENKDEQGELKRARQLISNINKTKKKLSELGISYDFFTPVDIPKEIASNVQVNIESGGIKNDAPKNEEKSKKKIKKSTELIVQKPVIKAEKVKVKTEDKENIAKDVKSKKNKKVDEPVVEKQKSKQSTASAKRDKASTVSAIQVKPDKKSSMNVKNSKIQVVDKKEQKKKNASLKSKGVAPIEDFIKVEQDEDSDSSADFDSDEFEKLLENYDDDELSSDMSNDDGSASEDLENGDDSDEDSKQKVSKKNNKPTPRAPLPWRQEKRKIPQKTAPSTVPNKKQKFEKQTKQSQRNKTFKKKNK